jgi:hypothetical protein
VTTTLKSRGELSAGVYITVQCCCTLMLMHATRPLTS